MSGHVEGNADVEGVDNVLPAASGIQEEESRSPDVAPLERTISYRNVRADLLSAVQFFTAVFAASCLLVVGISLFIPGVFFLIFGVEPFKQDWPQQYPRPRTLASILAAAGAFLVLLGISAAAIAVVLFKRLQRKQRRRTRMQQQRGSTADVNSGRARFSSIGTKKELFYKECSEESDNQRNRRFWRLKKAADAKKAQEKQDSPKREFPCPLSHQPSHNPASAPTPQQQPEITVLDYFDKHVRSVAGDSDLDVNGHHDDSSIRAMRDKQMLDEAAMAGTLVCCNQQNFMGEQRLCLREGPMLRLERKIRSSVEFNEDDDDEVHQDDTRADITPFRSTGTTSPTGAGIEKPSTEVFNSNDTNC